MGEFATLAILSAGIGAAQTALGAAQSQRRAKSENQAQTAAGQRQLQQQALAAEIEERRRQEQLKRERAQRLARFGGQGIASTGGSADAVLRARRRKRAARRRVRLGARPRHVELAARPRRPQPPEPAARGRGAQIRSTRHRRPSGRSRARHRAIPAAIRRQSIEFVRSGVAIRLCVIDPGRRLDALLSDIRPLTSVLWRYPCPTTS